MYVDIEDWKRVVGLIAGGVFVGTTGAWLAIAVITAGLAALL